MGYVFGYAIYHQNSHSFGAICKWANGYLKGLNLLKFVTFCCLLFVVVGFFSCIQLPAIHAKLLTESFWSVGWLVGPTAKGGSLKVDKREGPHKSG